ncbi:hypothetical protein ASE98_23065 [Pseudomonas sp. Leaf48]|nr:hypothetical protein ASE98_23065 [Pseudomonas sp. Leaf48]
MDSVQHAQAAVFPEKPTVSPLSQWERVRVRATAGSGSRSQVLRSPNNALQHIAHLLNHLQITEPHNPDPLLLQVLGSTQIMDSSRHLIVLTAIQFNGQFQFDAIKIQDIRRTWKLSAEFQIGDLPGPQFLPEQVFAVGLVGA